MLTMLYAILVGLVALFISCVQFYMLNLSSHCHRFVNCEQVLTISNRVLESAKLLYKYDAALTFGSRKLWIYSNFIVILKILNEIKVWRTFIKISNRIILVWICDCIIDVWKRCLFSWTITNVIGAINPPFCSSLSSAASAVPRAAWGIFRDLFPRVVDYFR